MQTDTLVTYLIDQLRIAEGLLPKLAVTDDAEDIHRFRVALRRSRSLLKLYAPNFYAIEAVLKTIFKPTNTLRELDVLLLSINNVKYPNLYKQLQAYCDEQYKTTLTVAYITRSRSVLRQLMDELRKIDTGHSDSMLIERAGKYAKQTDSAYSKINPKSRPKELHNLRIAYKSVRYAFEFLKESGLTYEKKRLKHARRRQEELGALQDAHNQLEILRSFCDTSSSAECKLLYKLRKKAYKKLLKTTMSNL